MPDVQIGANTSGVYPAYSSTSINAESGAIPGLGDRFEDHNGNRYVFISASTSVTSYQVVAITSDFRGQPATSALASAAAYVGVAQNNISAGSYGWVQTRGNMTVNALSTCSTAVALYTSGTAGSVDDTSTSQVKIAPLVINANITAATSTAAFAATDLFVAL